MAPKDPNAMISWISVTAAGPSLCALVLTIEAGEFVMLDYGIRISVCNKWLSFHTQHNKQQVNFCLLTLSF